MNKQIRWFGLNSVLVNCMDEIPIVHFALKTIIPDGPGIRQVPERLRPISFQISWAKALRTFFGLSADYQILNSFQTSLFQALGQ